MILDVSFHFLAFNATKNRMVLFEVTIKYREKCALKCCIFKSLVKNKASLLISYMVIYISGSLEAFGKKILKFKFESLVIFKVV